MRRPSLVPEYQAAISFVNRKFSGRNGWGAILVVKLKRND